MSLGEWLGVSFRGEWVIKWRGGEGKVGKEFGKIDRKVGRREDKVECTLQRERGTQEKVGYIPPREGTGDWCEIEKGMDLQRTNHDVHE